MGSSMHVVGQRGATWDSARRRGAAWTAWGKLAWSLEAEKYALGAELGRITKSVISKSVN